MDEQKFLEALYRYFGMTVQFVEALRSDQSYEALRGQIEQALNKWPAKPGAEMRVRLTYSDRVVASSFTETERTYIWRIWEIPWAKDEAGAFIFGTPIEVREVDLYEPMSESQQGGKQGRFQETLVQSMLVESAGDVKRIKAVGITSDVVNGNKRRYPRAVLASAVAKLNGNLRESAGQGRLIATGEAEHPGDKSGRPNILETVVKWEAASLDASGQVLLEGVILPTAKGRDVQVLAENGVPIGVSMRGYGSFTLVEEAKSSIQQVTDLTITGFDLVAQPSDPNGRLMESQQPGESEVSEGAKPKESKAMNLEELSKLLQENPKLRESLMGQLGLTDLKALAESLGAKSVEDLTRQFESAQKASKELEQRKLQESIDAAITESCKDLKYGDLNADFMAAVRKAAPATVEAVKPLIEAKRVEWDALFAKTKLASMGKGSGVQVMGPMFERDTGRPEFVRAAFALNESLVKAGEGHRRDVLKGDSPAEIFAARALERFDTLHQAKLLQEARMFEEAEQTSDLNLPYSVARMLIEQAYPELIAANVYDFGVTDMSPARIYYEAYDGESGAAPAVVDETVTAVHNTWVSMANKRLRPGTVVVTNSGNTTTYVDGTDYVIDYEVGAIYCFSTGAITNSQSLRVDYTYDKFRAGEMVAIQRAKNTLTYTTLDMAADRLAMQISNEAIVFSRSQMNYDAVTRTLGNLARLVRRKIDKDILYKGLSRSLIQANNSGGTWTAASDAVSQFVEKLGVAKVKVYNRNYVPTSIIMSVTNADRLSNWDGFKRDGFPNAVLNAAGFAGGIKGLPIFASTEYPDTYAQVVNRELVAHRVMQPAVFKGPFPSYDSNANLIGADQYYMEEFNGSLVPVDQKTAHVKIA